MKNYILLILFLFCSVVNAQVLTNYQGKIISKNGKIMTAPEGIVFISVQTAVLNQVTIYLRIDEGKSVNINWGNGASTVAIGTGVNTPYTSNYINSNSTYIIQVTGDLDFIRRFEISEPTVKFSSTNQLYKLTGLQEFYLIVVDFISLNIDLLPSSLTHFYISVELGKGTVVGDISLKPNLVVFNIGNQPNNVTGSITNLTNLTTLYVRGSNTISGSITNLTNLTSLTIAGLNSISGSITNLTKLTNLNIGSVSSSLTGSVTNLTLLTELQFDGNSVITGDVTNLTGLIILNVICSNTLSGSITNMTNLNLIQLSYSTVSGSVTNLTKLTFINVSPTSNLSGSVNNLVLANRLTFGSNSLSDPLNLYSLSKLTQVSIVNNTSITTFVAPSSSAILLQTYLSGNNIDKFDFSNTPNINGDLRIYSNLNDTAFVLPTTLTGAFTRIDAHGNALNRSSVDQMFSKLNSYFLTHTPTANLYIDVSGGTNSAPTNGWSNSDIVSLENIFSAAGKILTINKN